MTALPSSSALPLTTAAPARRTQRIAAIDWMRGLVMVLMVIDHASMAFDGSHVAKDSAMYPDAMTMALPAAEFFTRWITHLCAPTFVFLAGTALALSVERRVGKGANAWEIDRGMLIRGAIIGLLDLTVISAGSRYIDLGVLLAIGLSMICMVPLRRLPTPALLGLSLGWLAFGEVVTDWVWDPPGSAQPLAAFLFATSGGEVVVNKYPLVPWLSIMILGWVFGRYLNAFAAGKARLGPKTVLLVGGAVALAVFAVVRYLNGYGNMFLRRADQSWQQWLHVSKYPPSLAFTGLEIGLLCLCLASLMAVEPKIGVRPNGPFLVFGQTAMFFYLAHRLALEVPASYFGLRGAGNLVTTYVVAVVLLVLLYPVCLWYRRLKGNHPDSLLKYL
jgi:uncharacterized membrane protein